MKTEMRRELAREPFEQKIRKLGQLIQLSGKLKAQRALDRAEDVAYLKRAREKEQSVRPNGVA